MVWYLILIQWGLINTQGNVVPWIQSIEKLNGEVLADNSVWFGINESIYDFLSLFEFRLLHYRKRSQLLTGTVRTINYIYIYIYIYMNNNVIINNSRSLSPSCLIQHKMMSSRASFFCMEFMVIIVPWVFSECVLWMSRRWMMWCDVMWWVVWRDVTSCHVIW